MCLLVFACHLTFMLTLHLFGKLCDTSLSGIKLNAAGAGAGCATLGGSVIPCLLELLPVGLTQQFCGTSAQCLVGEVGAARGLALSSAPWTTL